MIVFLILENGLYAQSVLHGKVIDERTLSPLPGASLNLLESNETVYSDSSGEFIFTKIPGQIFRIRAYIEGYHKRTVTVNFDSVKTLKEVILPLIPFESSVDTIEVNTVYFKKNEDIHTSIDFAKHDELRKMPGTVEDIIKYFQSSTGVSIANDNNNDLMVRGGSPIENLTYIDGIEILNPNHYGPPGSTSGALSFINLKLVDEVSFYSGGFPVKFGNRISSVMDIKLKEGDEERHWRDLNISFTGFGGFFEGPISKKLSYMFSVRRSYLELIKKQLNFGYLPNYWDFNIKLNYDLNKTDKISFVGLYAIDKTNPYDKYLDIVDFSSTPVNLKLFSGGFNYTQDRRTGLLRLTVSHNYSDYDAHLSEFDIKIKDNQLNFNTEYKKPISNSIKLDVTFELKYIFSTYHVFSLTGFTPTYYSLPSVSYDANLHTYRIGVSANILVEAIKNKLDFNTGIRVDYLDMMKNGFGISPRAGLSYKFLPQTTLNLNVGIYSQQPEYLWLLSGSNKENLLNINCKEAIIGLEHFFSRDVRINLEAYYKYYTNYPVSVYDPYYNFINLSGIYPTFLSEASSSGKGYFTGVDITIQKKNSGLGLYSTVNLSYTRSSFIAIEGGYQPSMFDYGKQAMVIAGYKFMNDFSVSFRLKYSDGRPYTPFDGYSSVALGFGVFDMTKYNADRMPYYLRLDVRIDKNFKLGPTELIAYVEVWNLLDRLNVYEYDWNGYGIQTISHWSRVPILGLSYRF